MIENTEEGQDGAPAGDGGGESGAEEQPLSIEEQKTLKAKLAEAETKLKGFENKDFNFKRLREKRLSELTPEEKKELLGDELAVVEQKAEETRQSVLKERYDDSLDAVVGDDAELREKVEFHYKRISGPETTRAEIAAKMRDALKLAKSTIGDSDSLAGATFQHRVSAPKNKDKKFTETEAGQKFAKSLGIDLNPKKQ